MKNLPLTIEQIKVCDFILAHNNFGETYSYLEDHGFGDFDNRIASKFMLDNNLITSIHPVVLTDTGSQYSKKGFVKYIRDKRRNEFFNSPTFKVWFVIIPIVISLIFNVTNCKRTNQMKSEDSLNRKQIEQVDTLIKKYLKT